MKDKSFNKEDIIKSFKEAKNKSKQITILSQLYCMSVEDIISIIVSNGYDINTGKKITEEKKNIDIKDDKPKEKKIHKNFLNRPIQVKDDKKHIPVHVKFKPITNKAKIKKEEKKEEIKMDNEIEKKEEVNTNKRNNPISSLISDEDLKKRYLDNKETISSIAKSIGVGRNSLQSYMWRHGIKRTTEENKVKTNKKVINDKQSICINDEIDRLKQLEEKYLKKIKEIQTIINYLEKTKEGINNISI